jgi:hypothetical protein
MVKEEGKEKRKERSAAVLTLVAEWDEAERGSGQGLRHNETVQSAAQQASQEPSLEPFGEIGSSRAEGDAADKRLFLFHWRPVLDEAGEGRARGCGWVSSVSGHGRATV